MIIETLLPYWDASQKMRSYSSFTRLDGSNLMECVMLYSESPSVKAAAIRALGATPELVEGNGAA